MMPRVSEVQGRKTSAATTAAARIATPPSPGTGRSCRSRSRGWCWTPSRRASRATGGVAAKAISAATRNAPRASSSSISEEPSEGPGRSGARDHVKGDRRVLERGGKDHERVEYLVVSEHARCRIGALEGVNERAEGVEEPAHGHERRGGHTEP